MTNYVYCPKPPKSYQEISARVRRILPRKSADETEENWLLCECFIKRFSKASPTLAAESSFWNTFVKLKQWGLFGVIHDILRWEQRNIEQLEGNDKTRWPVVGPSQIVLTALISVLIADELLTLENEDVVPTEKFWTILSSNTKNG